MHYANFSTLNNSSFVIEIEAKIECSPLMSHQLNIFDIVAIDRYLKLFII